MKSNLIYCLTTYNYQILALFMGLIGLLGVIICRNLIKVLISAEFIINAINILFISYSSYQSTSSYIGYSIVLFTSGISAVVITIGIYFLYLIQKKEKSLDADKIFQKKDLIK